MKPSSYLAILLTVCLLTIPPLTSTLMSQEPTSNQTEEVGAVFGTKSKEKNPALTQTGRQKRAKTDRTELFKRIDKDINGLISKDEFMATKTSKKSPMKSSINFSAMDTNNDGLLTLEEFKNPPKKSWKN